VQYDYIMTVWLHLLFFWAGKDDVGSGYIRRGVSSENARQEFFQVLFGSDPEKAPRAINRWGAGTEVAWHKDPVSAQACADDIVASGFFGFMKSSRGKSVSEMPQELKKGKEKGEHSFTGILSRVEPSSAISMIVPMQPIDRLQLAPVRPRPAHHVRTVGRFRRPGQELARPRALPRSQRPYGHGGQPDGFCTTRPTGTSFALLHTPRSGKHSDAG
jgi:hypothetical protein